jgi:hypothetical protein
MVVPVFTIEHKKRGQLGSQMVSLIKVQGGSNMTGTDCGVFTHK